MTAAAPSGVVTFLFTDVEGSTRRWEADAQAMRSALVAHDKVLRTAIEAYGGFLFSHTGDGVAAAFASPMSAVNAAIDSIRSDAPALPAHIWRQIAAIVPAVRRVERQSMVDGVTPSAIDAEHVGREHLRDTVAELLHSSELISEAVAEGRLAIVGANYRLAEGTAVPDIVIGLGVDDA